MPRKLANFLMFAWMVVLIGLLVYDRSYDRFIRREFWPLLAGAAVLLLGLCWARLRAPASGCCDGHEHEGHDHGHDHQPSTVKTLGAVVVLALPLAYMPLAWQKSLGAAAFAKRFVEEGNSAANANVAAAPAAPDPAAPKTEPVTAETTPAQVAAASAAPEVKTEAAPATPVVAEIVANVMQLQYRGEDYKGKVVETEGMVYRGTDVPAGYVIVFRFSVTCCAADAQPGHVLVTEDKVPKVENSTWVRVVGTLDMRTGESPKPYIKAAQVTEIEEPEQPYLYTDPTQMMW